ncbi:6707_t:CDS:2, partial [Acaulospora colombiana]
MALAADTPPTPSSRSATSVPTLSSPIDARDSIRDQQFSYDCSPSTEQALDWAIRNSNLSGGVHMNTGGQVSSRPSTSLSVRSFGSNSSISSSSSSSTSTSTPVLPPLSASTTGRKVAANLQLFKETAPPLSPTRRSTAAGISAPPDVSTTTVPDATAEEGEELIRETQFVKRTAWPEREAAAVRRGKSIPTTKRTTLVSPSPDRDWDLEERDRVSRERGSSSRAVVRDLREWHQENLERGRTRDRIGDTGSDSEGAGAAAAVGVNASGGGGIVNSASRARSAKPDPISIPSPLSLNQRPPLAQRASAQSVRTLHSAQPISPGHDRKRSVTFSIEDLEEPRAISPVQETTPPPPYPREATLPSSSLESPYSTDSESAWDTTSVASSVATTRSSTALRKLKSRSRSPSPDMVDRAASPPRRRSGQREEFEEDEQQLDDEGTFGTLDDLESTPLPNVPLTPFRNQVGGHSAIYKFTKRAVCKPLVSRENLFYEAVESAAPPLLGFIPRYLGVMLVNYRKVRKSGNSSPPQIAEPVEEEKTIVEGDDGIKSDSVVSEPPPSGTVESPPRPPLRKANTAQGLPGADSAKRPRPMSPLSHSPVRGRAPRVQDDAGEQASGEDTEDAEQPVVQLDNNPHILPGWMLRGRREYFRTLPTSTLTPRGATPGMMTPLTSDDKNPLIKRLQAIERAAISSPELANTKETATGMSVSVGTIKVVTDLELGDLSGHETPTLSNSPEQPTVIPKINTQIRRNYAPSVVSGEEEIAMQGYERGMSSVSIGGTPTSYRYPSSGYASPNGHL